MSAPYRTEPDTLDAIRADLDALVAPPPAATGTPQTARSIGMGPAWADLADVVDLASLAAGRRRHAYRMAADAVDHLIALMDVLEADTEDMEDGADDEPTGDDELSLGWREGVTQVHLGQPSDDGEPSLGAPENHPGRFHVDMDARYHVGVRHHPLGDQTTWAAGQDADTDALDQGESEAGYDLACDDNELDGNDATGDCGDREHSLGWNETVSQLALGTPTEDGDATALERFGKGFIRSGPDDSEDSDPAEDGHDAEAVYEDGSDDDPHPWRFERPDAVQRAAQLCEVARYV